MQDKSTSNAGAGTAKGEPIDFLPAHQPAIIAKNNFKYKSLSNWAFNISLGCVHACRFCYVPSTSAIKQGRQLKKYGVTDPDEQWGEYVLLRPWDEKKFMASLRRADQTPASKLKPDGNRAVMFCTTTDPYQVLSRLSQLFYSRSQLLKVPDIRKS